MSAVWIAVPSARPVDQVENWAEAWHERGYKVAVYRDTFDDVRHFVDLCITKWAKYPGYAQVTNELVRQVLVGVDQECQWVVLGGDDVFPDPNHDAETIARQCTEYFSCLPRLTNIALEPEAYSTFGVMQPTGHRWGDSQGAYIDRIAGSPWVGKEWCLRAHQGQGPLHPGFEHMHGDEALRGIAVKLGVYWERRELIHFHQHWGIQGRAEDMPEFLKKWNTPEHWRESRALLDRLKAEDFAECMPI